MGRALNVIWRVEEGRPFVKHKAHDLGWTVVVLALVLVTAVLVVLGGALSEFVFNQIGLGDTTAAVAASSQSATLSSHQPRPASSNVAPRTTAGADDRQLAAAGSGG